MYIMRMIYKQSRITTGKKLWQTEYMRPLKNGEMCSMVWKAVVDVPCNLQRVVIILQRVVDINQ